MPEALMQPCAGAESSSRRGVRYAAGALLVLFAFVECATASLMVAAWRGTPQLLYLLCALALFAAAVVALRERRRALVAVRVFAVATAVMLFWCSQATLSGPRIRIGGRLYDLLTLLAGMLLAAVLLPGLLRQRDSSAACNCQ